MKIQKVIRLSTFQLGGKTVKIVKAKDDRKTGPNTITLIVQIENDIVKEREVTIIDRWFIPNCSDLVEVFKCDPIIILYEFSLSLTPKDIFADSLATLKFFEVSRLTGSIILRKYAEELVDKFNSTYNPFDRQHTIAKLDTHQICYDDNPTVKVYGPCLAFHGLQAFVRARNGKLVGWKEYWED